MISYVCWDIENDTSEGQKYGRKAGHFLYDKIVAMGFKLDGTPKAEGWYLTVDDCPLEKYLGGTEIIVGHNLMHDLLFVWKNKKLQQWFKDGGRIWDTQYAHYLLSGQQHKYPALRDIAVNHYGCKEREKLMEPYWEQGKQTSEIPMELVLEDVKNDVLDTEAIYLQQIELIEERGLTNLMMGQMDFLLATIEMTYNGMLIDRERFDENKEKLQKELIEKQTKLKILTDKYWR